ncbi:MAG: hypothetical protein OET44_02380 [Gammaproteobacteria bacterium]|nr:hypothetical protein [Gammaproteobacteria bacterium]
MRVWRGAVSKTAARNTPDKVSVPIMNRAPCLPPRRGRGALINPQKLTERLLKRDGFVASCLQNVLAAAWPVFYRRVTQPAETCDKPRDWWTGPALLQLLFAQEHNTLYRQLAKAHPSLGNARLHAEARNICIALLSKIHSQWRASLIPVTEWHRPLQRLRHYALPHESIRRSGPSSIDHLLACIIPLLPDRFDIHSAVSGVRLGPAEGFGFVALCDPHAREFIEYHDAANLWYSFGIGSAGAFQLRNHCMASRRLPVQDGRHFENLAANAIKRHRRSHPASYNALRQLLGLTPIRDFSDLDPHWTACVAECYSRAGDIDCLIGLLAERRNDNSAMGETALRCLTLFERGPCVPELSSFGKTWLRENSLKTLLLRHYPILQDALYRIDNPFAHWRALNLI